MTINGCDSNIGKIKSVLFVANRNCRDFDYILSWVRAIKPDNGILILDDVDLTNCNILSTLCRNYNIIPFEIVRNQNVGLLPIDDFFLVHKNFILQFIDTIEPPDVIIYGMGTVLSNQRKMYITVLHDYPQWDLSRNKKFDALLSKFGLKAQYLSPDCQVEAGDYLRAGNHVFIGNRAWEKNGKSDLIAEASIRCAYDVDAEVSIDFFHVSCLYHLDLYFTYGGKNKAGAHQFFVGSIDNPHYANHSNELKSFRDNKLKTILKNRYADVGEEYEVTEIPILIYDSESDMLPILSSPLNGIWDFVDSNVIYYIPNPHFGDGSHYSERCKAAIAENTRIATDIFESKIGRNNVMPLNVPISNFHFSVANPAKPVITGGGQSLHCSIAVVGRE